MINHIMKTKIDMRTVTVGERGQVVIPQEFRKEIGIKPQEKLVALKIERRIIYVRIEDFLTDRWIRALSLGLKDLTFEEIEKQREKVDREMMK